jgi:hypothetical protein
LGIPSTAKLKYDGWYKHRFLEEEEQKLSEKGDSHESVSGDVIRHNDERNKAGSTTPSVTPVLPASEPRKKQRRKGVWAALIVCAIIAGLTIFLCGPKPDDSPDTEKAGSAAADGETAKTVVQTEEEPLAADAQQAESGKEAKLSPDAGSETTVKTLSDQETHEKFTAIAKDVETVTSYLGDYNEKYWQSDHVSMEIETVRQEEAKWSEYRDMMAGRLEEMNQYQPSELFQSSWEYLYQIAQSTYTYANDLSHWDTNNDGEYSDEECVSANQNALDTAIKTQDPADRLSEAYDKALREYTAKYATKQVQQQKKTTVKRNSGSITQRKTTTQKSDPYNAKDYMDPEDFYEDNYDDFWDFEDAEDYWDEHH